MESGEERNGKEANFMSHVLVHNSVSVSLGARYCTDRNHNINVYILIIIVIDTLLIPMGKFLDRLHH